MRCFGPIADCCIAVQSLEGNGDGIFLPLFAVCTPMKLLCAQSDLNSGLSLVSRAVPARPSHPVLANVLLTCDVATGRVSLTGFDLSLGLQTSFAAEVEESGEIALPAKLLSDIVAKLPNGPLSLAADSDHAATILAQSGRYQVQGMSGEEFTALPTIEGGEATYLPAPALLEGMHGSLFAASSDETKQVLTGVRITLESAQLEFAATDGHRLAVVSLPLEVEEDTTIEAFASTVPARTLRELERILASTQSEEPVAIYSDRGQIAVQWCDYYLTSRTLEGQYPAYNQLIPRQFERQITVERRILLSALERIAVLADQKSNHIVKFSLDQENQVLTISADAQDVGSGSEAINSVQISGEDLEIAFNVRYLMESLKNLTSSEVQIQLNTPTSPAIVTPLGGPKTTHLVMPVQVRN